MNSWLLVPILIVGGIIIGMVLSRLLHALASSPSRPEPIQEAAGPLSTIGLAVGVVGGLIAALGVISPDALSQLPKDVIAFVPKAIMAAIILIIAKVLAAFATTALAQALGRMPLSIQRQANMGVKTLIYVLATLLAVSQLGVDTEVVNMGVGAVFFGTAASLTLLVGLGGYGVAREVASTRALKRLINQGDVVRIGEIRGIVKAVHPTAVEVTSPTGETVLIPSSSFLSKTIEIERTDTPASPE